MADQSATRDAPTLSYIIRPARATDLPALRTMQARSMRELGRGFYGAAEITAFLRRIGTMDDAVALEGHYLVAEDARGTLLASGGWSQLTPGYAAIAKAARLGPGSATVRSVFVDPSAARRGVGSAIMQAVEEGAAGCGIGRLGLAATLSGVALYAKLGYRALGSLEVDLGDGTRFGCVKMEKWLDGVRAQAA